MSNSATKLTKKQKKGLAFRDGSSRKSSKATRHERQGESHDLPVTENQDLPELQAVDENVIKSRETSAIGLCATAIKRKRDNGADTASEILNVKQPKRRKSTDKDSESDPSKQRFILFLGNLKYTTSKAAIAAHFATCGDAVHQLSDSHVCLLTVLDPPPAIRLLTPKPRHDSDPKSKSKGCAFLEFSHRNALQQGLKFHGSNLEGREINVELTAGGGGKGGSRLEKLRERNRGLGSQRTERKVKQAAESGAPKPFEDRPQRFSTTSGAEIPLLKMRTWTVGDSEELGHRGGKKHQKRGRPASRKSFGTGANLIVIRSK